MPFFFLTAFAGCYTVFKTRGPASSEMASGPEYIFTGEHNFVRKSFYNIVKKRSDFEWIEKSNKLENANYFKLAAEYMLTPEYERISIEDEVIRVSKVLMALVAPLPYEGTTDLKSTRERDFKVSHRINSKLKLRLRLLFSLAQLMNKYKNKHQALLGSPLMDGLRNIAKFDSLSVNRRLALLAYISIEKDKEKSLKLLEYAQKKDGEVVFEASTSGDFSEYRFLKTDGGSEDFILRFNFSKAREKSMGGLGLLAYRSCKTESLLCSSEDEPSGRIQSYRGYEKLISGIEDRIKLLGSLTQVETGRSLGFYIADLNFEINEVSSKINRVEKGCLAGHLNCSGVELASLRVQVRSLKKRREEAYGAGVPHAYLDELRALLEELRSMESKDLSRYTEASNGVTVVYALKNRGYAEDWFSKIKGGGLSFYQELLYLAGRCDLGSLCKFIREYKQF